MCLQERVLCVCVFVFEECGDGQEGGGLSLSDQGVALLIRARGSDCRFEETK